MDYGYARVSSTDQNLDRQLNAFQQFGIKTKDIFCDKKSGKDFERKNYKRLLKKLKKSDLIVIKSIDRLGRNYQSIISEWNHIVNIIGADILVLDMPLLDTRTKTETLIGKFISDIVLQVLSFVAETERDNIRARQSEGIRLAQARGVKFGRPSKEYTKDFLDIVLKYKQKSVTLKDALFLAKITKTTFYYHIKKIEGRSVACL